MRSVLDRLTVSQPFYRLADAPELLYIARTILVDGASAFEYEVLACLTRFSLYMSRLKQYGPAVA